MVPIHAFEIIAIYREKGCIFLLTPSVWQPACIEKVLLVKSGLFAGK
ncbi:MAG: hypothetical protein AVDCRST_MAG56-3120 [uncultured Cytophagales bacterium]|uniref:Uncharacterized protein n=1 Tax=uncultured Cytophagales bacterium TaxID=158755 RepID=A0A6J4J6L7_9SPHI|nr:MAG: hypothetical protein AVDCRST_MAG56-3120 [uncultured Cytophagales bacterium]